MAINNTNACIARVVIVPDDMKYKEAEAICILKAEASDATNVPLLELCARALRGSAEARKECARVVAFFRRGAKMKVGLGLPNRSVKFD